MILPLFCEYDYNEDDLFYMFYNPEENRFYYDGGFLTYNIFDVMSPNEVYLFKLRKEDILIRTSCGDLYAIIYEDDRDE